jgi:predicted metalloprotease with PDZ domain
MSEISQRLKSVTNGAPTQEFTLRRNQMGQLGFHVQHDGLITEVENFGYAWQTGLRQGSRLVEVDVILYDFILSFSRMCFRLRLVVK